MTKKESIEYITKEIVKSAAESVRESVGGSALGNITVKYRPNDASVSLAFGNDALAIRIMTDIFDSGNVRVHWIVTERPEKVIAMRKSVIYYYRDSHTKTDIKRWCISKFEQEAADAVTVFLAETAKRRRM